MNADLIHHACAADPFIPVPVMLGHQRTDATVARRHAAMWIACQQGDSLPAIGRAFNRDHSTIWHARRRVDAILTEQERQGLRKMQPEYAIGWIAARLIREKRGRNVDR